MCRMIREITALVSNKDRSILKTKPYWSMFSPKHLVSLLVYKLCYVQGFAEFLHLEVFAHA